ncbi:MAG: Na+/H+ antiporter subunit E [Thermodesulfobacteriota bacterium]
MTEPRNARDPGETECPRKGSFNSKDNLHPFISAVLTFAISFILWIILSGQFDLFHISLGLISCAIVTWLSKDLLFVHTDFKNLPKRWIRFLGYLPWLLYQVLLANLHLLYLVCHPKMMDLIDPRIIQFKSRLSGDMALVTFANSITLTPGTITVYVSIYGDFSVHAIDKYSGESLPGEMEQRIKHVFGE